MKLNRTLHVLALLACSICLQVQAAPAPASPLPAISAEILPFNWDQEMAKAIKRPNDIASRVNYVASTNDKGTWTTVGNTQIWRLAVSVPTALSMSFHAKNVKLPEGSMLTMSGGGQTYDLATFVQSSGELWSRLVPGDGLELQVTLPSGKAADLRLDIVEVFAGFKSMDGGATHPAYQRAKSASVSPQASSCDVNYQCVTTAGDLNPSRATLAIVIQGTSLCSGTLMNDIAGDFKNYILTAAHCAESTPGNPATFDSTKAGTMVFYWNALTPCGSPLASATSAATATSTGATHRMQNNDSWLVEASSVPPPGAYPYYQGWNATDTVPVGSVYGVHHANTNTKQYVASSAPPSKVTAPFGPAWSFANTTGTTAGGASGSQLVDSANGELIGHLYGGNALCPGDPSGPNVQYTRFNSTFVGGDTSVTAASFWLDPTTTGTTAQAGTVNPARAAATVTLGSSATTGTVGNNITLTWNTTNAASCTATNGWTGTKATANAAAQSQALTSGAAGAVTYTLQCAGEPTTDTKSVTVTWQAAAAPAASSGGGSLSLDLLAALVLLAFIRKRGCVESAAASLKKISNFYQIIPFPILRGLS